MASITPQIFPKELPDEMMARDVYSYDTTHAFYIPDCQDIEPFKRINTLSSLFFLDNFDRCLEPNGGVNIDQIREYFGTHLYPELDKQGMIPSRLFEKYHVLNRADYEKWLKESAPYCPLCNKEIRVLITCPLWELKCAFPAEEIQWSAENRSKLDSHEEISVPLSSVQSAPFRSEVSFGVVHMAFLIEMAFLGTSFVKESDFPEGIISKFLFYDREHSQEILEALQDPATLSRTQAWIEHLQTSSQLPLVRTTILSFLTQHRFPSDYSPGSFSKNFAQAFAKEEAYKKLLELKQMCERASVPQKCPDSPSKHARPTMSENRCLPIRLALAGVFFLFTFVYFLFKILWPFFKIRIFLNGDDL